MELSIFKKNSKINEFLNLNNIDSLTKFTIDRFENEFAVCENRNTGKIINIPQKFISKKAISGDIIKLENNLYVPDNELIDKEINEVKNLANSVFRKKE